MKCVLSFN